MGIRGTIGKILAFTRAVRNGARVSDTKHDPGGSPVITSEHFADPGDDSHPLPGDYVFAVPGKQKGREVATGYLDPINAPKAQPGDKRIYARDAGAGALVVEVWLKNDGTATIFNSAGVVTLSPLGSILGQNGAGQFELEVGGDFVVNGAVITTDGEVIDRTGVSLRHHTHAQGADGNGDAEQETDPPTVP